MIRVAAGNTNTGSTEQNFRSDNTTIKWQKLLAGDLHVLVSQAIAGAIHQVEANAIIGGSKSVTNRQFSCRDAATDAAAKVNVYIVITDTTTVRRFSLINSTG